MDIGSLVVVIILFLVMFGIAKRYLGRFGDPFFSAPSVFRTFVRMVGLTIRGTWRGGRGLARLLRGRRRMRPRTSRTSIGGFR
jgi:hypothetical protein